MKFSGKALKLGDNINTDLIIPGKYLHLEDPVELAQHVLEGLDGDFVKTYQKGDILVVGKNFGSGSSREQAALALKYAGVQTMIGTSFARIFFRNANNQGIYLFESQEAVNDIESADWIDIDSSTWTISNTTKKRQYNLQPLPEFLLAILENGGLVPYLRQKEKTKI